jgi:hypothetical protein
MDNLIRKPFKKMRTDEERAKDTSNVYTVRLNLEEEAQIVSAGKFLQQPKISTLIKQLAILCARDILQDKKVQDKLLIATNNVRRNMETGTFCEMPSDKEIKGNVIQNEWNM